MDRGYLRFTIKSAQAQITPDRKSVYVAIVVDEGKRYTFEGYRIEGRLIVPRSEYEQRIKLHPGDVFSRQKIIDSEKAISSMLGDRGYMFANVSVRPQINDATQQVFVTFDIKPGKRAYVRHVTFSDNNRTNDIVLRREIEQMESAPVSTSKLEQSKHRLNMLPFLKDAEMSVRPVPGEDDQVDVNYKVKEDSSAQATFKVGYSQIAQVILGAGLNQKNFMGTGNTLGLNLQRSNYEQFYGIDYTNPYYTVDGISRSFTFAISHVNPRAVYNLNNGYSTNEYDLGVLYGIPIGQEVGVFDRAQVGAFYQDTLVTLNAGKVSNQVNTFVTRNGRRYQELDIRLGVSRDSRDKAIFPTRGSLQSAFVDLFAPLTNNSVSFYTFNYHAKWYQPVVDEFIVLTKGDFSYGNGFHGVRYYPFFRNFYSGGFDTVRGYQGYTLGPRDSNGQAYGGNLLLDASIGLIFPNYLSDSLRTSVFFDAGNVYYTGNNKGFGCSRSGKTCSRNSGPIRYAAGIEGDIITPFGPVSLSLAKPLNLRKGDDQEIFQLSLGANF
jgi:outer membrane protein insertion porin family